MGEINPGNTNGVTVIICCYNSAARLPQTLKHLQEQVIPDEFYWEIILVNNASKDNTATCAKTIWEKEIPHNASCRIVDEQRPGQMFARKTGAAEARYEYIIFCDDDNWLQEDYVRLSYSMMQKDSRIGAGGGQNSPVTDADKYPEWFEEYKDKYALGIPAAASGDVSYKGFVLGAGLVTRKSLFLEVFDDKYPSLLNGRNGEKLSTGDDFEYCKRVLLWDYTLYYEDRLYLRHFIPKERLTVFYRERLMEGIIDAGKVLTVYDDALQAKRKIKNKSKWRLFLLTPFRMILARMGLSKRDLHDEKLVFFYSSPFYKKAEPVKTAIKKFLNHK